MRNLRCVILAGGLGTRLRESTEFKPKPMIEIDSNPILWHIMKSYSYYGVNNFVICTGYMREIITNYFLHYNYVNQDIDINLELNKVKYLGDAEKWNVLVSNTGLQTMTGGRIHKIKKYIKEDNFLCTYGDAVSDINIQDLYNFHLDHGKIATMMVVRQPSRFGVVEVDKNSTVENFREKPIVDGWVNAGYFIFNKKIFDYLTDDSVLEQEPLTKLALLGELKAFKHNGFWQAMDTFREQQILTNLIKNGNAPWIKW